jgi:hypothetical protein
MSLSPQQPPVRGTGPQTLPRKTSVEAAAGGLVADVLRVAMLMEVGDHAAAELVARGLADPVAVVMAAAAMIRTDTAVPLDFYVTRVTPAARRFLEGHGTIGGYEQHRLRGADPCDACRTARQVYDRSRYRQRGNRAGSAGSRPAEVAS